MQKLTQKEFENLYTTKTQLHDYDLSSIQISPETLTGFVTYQSQDFVKGWTDNIIWPTEIIKTLNPQQMLESSKQPTEMNTVHGNGSTGKDIGIAIIDQRLFTEHPEYTDRIKHYEGVGPWPDNNTTTPDYHGSLVAGCAVGKTTGTAPDADLYYFAAHNWPTDNKFFKAIEKLTGEKLQLGHRKFINMAIRRMLEINKTLPEHKKIRLLSCSWGEKDDQFRTETEALFDECERNGIMVLGGYYKHSSTTTPCDKRYNNPTIRIGIPTNGKTTPFYKGGYVYSRLGGSSSTIPYLAGVFACALQGNTIFCTRENWQDELIEIMKQTASQHPMGGKIINPTGIVERVSQIARTMEMDLIKHQASQHE